MAMLYVNCLILGKTKGNIFTIEVHNTANVSQLKDAIKVKQSPLFANVPFADIRLCIAPNGFDSSSGSTTLPGPNLSGLSKVKKIFNTLDNDEIVHALIEPPPDKLTVFEFLMTTPSELQYIGTPRLDNVEEFKDLPTKKSKSKSCTKSPYAKTPPHSKAKCWEWFTNEVLSMEVDNQERKFDRPKFTECRDVASEMSVQAAFEFNILNNVNTFLRYRFGDAKFNRPETATNLMGKPDFVCVRSQEPQLITVIEINTRWVLGDDSLDLVNKYNTKALGSSGPVKRSIEQIYGYVRENNLRYGVLSTYDYTWFVMVSDNKELYVSNPIKYDAINPTLFQCLAYIISKANENPTRGPPPLLPNPFGNSSAENNDGTDSTGKGKHDGPSGNTRSHSKRQGTGGGSAIQGGASENHRSAGTLKTNTIKVGRLDLMEFRRTDVLGRGRSGVVFKAHWRDEAVALKVSDIAQEPDLEQELLVEVEVYNSLKKLQGRCIPRLLAAGFDGHVFFAIVTELAGSPVRVKELSNDERWEVLRALQLIHSNGFLHNDVRVANILIQRSPTGFRVNIIDFAFATRNTDKGLFAEELSCLKELLGLCEPTQALSQKPSHCLHTPLTTLHSSYASISPSSSRIITDKHSSTDHVSTSVDRASVCPKRRRRSIRNTTNPYNLRCV